MEEEISLKELFETLKKRLMMIIIITIMAVIASGFYSFYMLTPIYQTQTQMLVSQQATGASVLAAIGFDADAKYIDTYNVIIKSPYILDQVIDELKLTSTHAQLNNQISVSQEGRSQVVTLRVQHRDPALAVEIANTTAKIFQREIYILMRVDNVHVLSSAELAANPRPIKPNPNLNIAIALVLGLMTGVGLAFFLEFLDNTIRNEQDIERYLGLPILGAIPIMDDVEKVDKKEKRKRKGKKIS